MHDLTPDEVAAALAPPPTPLLVALWDGDRSAALALVAAGAEPNAADTRPVIGHGAMPLHFAADADDPEFDAAFDRGRGGRQRPVAGRSILRSGGACKRRPRSGSPRIAGGRC